jgi:phage terminase small subunit
MTPKQQRVCNFFLSGMTMRKALSACGYSEAYADHMSIKYLKNREVIAYIKERQKAEADAALADAICVKDNLLKIIKDPTSTKKEKSDALKILDQHNEWNKELLLRLDEIEIKKKELEIKSELLKNNSEKSSNEPIRITIETIEKKPE